MKIIQKVEILSDHQAEYQNYFMYGHGVSRMMRDGWYIKHIHDDIVKKSAWILWEKQVDETQEIPE